MIRGLCLKTRLVLSSLIFLALLMGVGGFFIFYGQQQLPGAYLLATGIIGLGCFGLFLWRQLGQISTPITELTEHLHARTEKNLHQPFQSSGNPCLELTQLFHSCNQLTSQLGHNLEQSRQFATDVSHELRTPLTILRGETELALHKNRTKEQLLQIFDSNLEEICRMSDLIEDLLMLSKSAQGEVTLNKMALNLNALLTELHAQAQLLADEKQIQVNLDLPKAQISLLADKRRLRQVFLNLLTNAIKYTPEGGTVDISCLYTDSQAQVHIKDNGIGIEPQHQSQIFDRFYRIDKKRNANDGGSGLGLAIAKWIVCAHQGRIEVVSHPGQGSCFTVSMPLT